MEGATFYFGFEPALMEWLQSGMNPVLTAIASVLTICGEELVVVGVLGFLYWVWDKEAAIYIGTNVLVGTVWNPLLKNIALRRRPYFDHPAIRCLKPVHAGDIYDIAKQGYSFPSGHSSNAVILYGSMPLAARRAGVSDKNRSYRIFLRIVIAMPLLIGLSRVVLGVHYPTDVLAGWALGVVVIALVGRLQERVRKRYLFHIALIVVSLPGFFYCKTNDYFTCFGIMCGFFAANALDEAYVHFKNTRGVSAGVWRMACGLVLYFGLNVLFKAPFSKEFLSSATTGQFLVRAARYFIVSFLMLGVYPALFGKVDAFQAPAEREKS